MPAKPAKFAELLRTLDAHGVEYVLVGGVAANLHGAPLATYDVDIVHRRAPTNVARLLEALRSINAHYWEHAPRMLVPDARVLLLPGHYSLQTDLGRIDILGQIGSGRSYDDLLGESVRIEIADGWSIRVLGLQAIIETKRETGRPKDLLALPVLEETLAESGSAPHPRDK
ncbi:MAG: hypothetical protein FJX72_06575 [Armatimonadetes bacterium]|nr:hypothetical protein [Armatimonadota bacterium]